MLKDAAPLRNKGERRATAVSLCGAISYSRRYFHGVTAGLCPIDALLGVGAHRLTAAVAALCCRLGIHQNFADASATLRELNGLAVGKETVRQVCQEEGERAVATTLAAAPLDASAGRVYLGGDGTMVATVQQTEKDKRRAAHAARRAARTRSNIPNPPRRPQRPGADGPYKELKILVAYTQGHAHSRALATCGDADAWGDRMQRLCRSAGVERFADIRAIIDGAPWLRGQMLDRLPFAGRMTLTLDFFHLAENIARAGRSLFGETEQATAWAREQAESVRTGGPTALLAQLGRLRRRLRSRLKRQAIDDLNRYVSERLDMLNYPAALAAGADIGSGPTEARCKTLTQRLDGSGMKWDPDHAESMMCLRALHDSPALWQTHFKSRPAA